jgi:hypothetical protein
VDTTIKKSGDSLPPIKVMNDSSEEWSIAIEFLPLGHDSSGSPITAPSSYRYAGHSMLSTKTPKFKLAAGGSKEVEVKVNVPKGRTGGAYAAMYVLGEPAKKDPNATMGANVRVGVLIELRLPGEAKRRISAGKVFALQEAAGGPINLYASATNLGEAHEKVGGVVVISNDKGEVAKVNLNPANVFPTMMRNIQATWAAPKTLPVGKYKLAATLAVAGLGSETAFGELNVIKPGEAEQNRLAVTKFGTKPVVQKTSLDVEATVLNQGNSPFAPLGRVAYSDANGEQMGTVELTSVDPIPVGKKGVLKGTLKNGLTPGSYSASLEVMNKAGALLASFKANQQVIEKEVVLAAKIGKFQAPSAKEPFVTIEIKNDGNVEIDVEGIVMVADSSGNVVGQIPLEKQHVGLGGSASYKRGLPEGLEPGLYELRAVLNYGGSGPAEMTAKHYVQ